MDQLILEILNSSLNNKEKAELLNLRQTQVVCKTLLLSDWRSKSEEYISLFVKNHNLLEIWSNTYYPKHKRLEAVGLKLHTRTPIEVVYYIGTYVDYDIRSALKEAA